jgi:hypothetical protein
MTDDNNQPDLSRPFRPAKPDLAALVAHPSLAPLRGQGWLLDRLPVTCTAWAFAGALPASFVAYGTTGGVLVMTWTTVTLLLAGLALATRDLRRARTTLNVARYGLLTLLVGVIALVSTVGALPSPIGNTRHATTSGHVPVNHAKVYTNQLYIVAP